MKAFGISLFVAGVVLVLFGISSSLVLREKIVENITGRFTTTTMLYLVGGIALVVGGGYLFFSGKSK